MNFNLKDTKNKLFFEWNADLISLCEREVSAIETILNEELETLERSLSSHPEEEIVPKVSPSSTPQILQTASRIRLMLQRLNRIGVRLLREQNELKQQLTHQQALYSEIEMERDVLLQQVHGYLQTNSSLRERLEEQRCQTGALQRQLNADLEEQIKNLENEKEKLSNLNTEKDKKIYVIYLTLEQTAKCLKKKEAEMLKLKNKENNLISSLKKDLQVALEGKATLEDKYAKLKEEIDVYLLSNNFESLSLKKKLTLKKSRSEGDLRCAPLHFIQNVSLEPDYCSDSDSSLAQRALKLFGPLAALRPDFPLLPKQPQKLGTYPPLYPNSAISSLQTTNECVETEKTTKNPKSPVLNQLNALKRGLFNVTRKLEMLKIQLISSGAIVEDPKPQENYRNLKRKASPTEDAEILEDPKSGFKNLKKILEDAKSLNAKLQHMREEKQKIIQSQRKEVGVQVTQKKNDELWNISEHPEPPFWEFQSEITKLKKSMRDCEEKINGHRMSAEEAFDFIVTALSACVLTNFKYFHEWRKRTSPWFGCDIDTNSLTDEGSKGSRELTSPEENGGGDNLLKKHISKDGLSCIELKIQIDRLRCKIKQRF